MRNIISKVVSTSSYWYFNGIFLGWKILLIFVIIVIKNSILTTLSVQYEWDAVPIIEYLSKF